MGWGGEGINYILPIFCNLGQFFGLILDSSGKFSNYLQMVVHVKLNHFLELKTRKVGNSVIKKASIIKNLTTRETNVVPAQDRTEPSVKRLILTSAPGIGSVKRKKNAIMLIDIGQYLVARLGDRPRSGSIKVGPSLTCK